MKKNSIRLKRYQDFNGKNCYCVKFKGSDLFIHVYKRDDALYVYNHGGTVMSSNKYGVPVQLFKV